MQHDTEAERFRFGVEVELKVPRAVKFDLGERHRPKDLRLLSRADPALVTHKQRRVAVLDQGLTRLSTRHNTLRSKRDELAAQLDRVKAAADRRKALAEQAVLLDEMGRLAIAHERLALKRDWQSEHGDKRQTPLGRHSRFGWLRAEHDGSLRATEERWGAELTTPILHGADGAAFLYDTLTTFREKTDAVADNDCGVHVHLGIFNTDALSESDACKFAAHLLYLYAVHQAGLFASTGLETRQNNQYCGALSARSLHTAARRAYVRSSRLQLAALFNVSGKERHRALNTLALSDKGTFEFRLFAGTSSADRVLGHVHSVLGLASLAYQAVKDGRPIPEEVPAVDYTARPAWEALCTALGWTGSGPMRGVAGSRFVADRAWLSALRERVRTGGDYSIRPQYDLASSSAGSGAPASSVDSCTCHCPACCAHR